MPFARVDLLHMGPKATEHYEPHNSAKPASPNGSNQSTWCVCGGGGGGGWREMRELRLTIEKKSTSNATAFSRIILRHFSSMHIYWKRGSKRPTPNGFFFWKYLVKRHQISLKYEYNISHFLLLKNILLWIKISFFISCIILEQVIFVKKIYKRIFVKIDQNR